MAAGTSPISFPQSSKGRLLVIIIERNSCRRMMISLENVVRDRPILIGGRRRDHRSWPGILGIFGTSI